MVKLNKIQKSGYMNLWDIVMFQVHIYCILNNKNLSISDIECITLLSINGEMELSDFCNIACEYEERDRDPENYLEKAVFKTPQSVRNSVSKLENLNIILKEGKSKKKIKVNPNLNIVTKDNIFIELKFLRKNDSEKQ
jgi:hypothetical protein